MAKRHDTEIEKYRNILKTPTEFKDGFGWSTVAGIFFCGAIMMPGSIYLGLMTGGDMTSAATWVTLILFSEVARRAIKPMSQQNLVTLYHAAHVMMLGYMMVPGGPIGPLVYRAFLVTSDAVRNAGMRFGFPDWWVPSADSPAIAERTLLHMDWAIPIALIVFMTLLGVVKKYTIGYFFFRLTSDIEKLPFPLAPITAQGVMALSEKHADAKDVNDGEGTNGGNKKKGSRWRLFSLGATLGLTFGFIQVGIPAITGLFLEKPIFLIPQPFIDTTTTTQSILPAVATGITLDLGIILLGFVLPFWAVMGTFAAIILTMLLNPMLYKAGLLTSWQPGMDTVNTTFANEIDFWMSFNIGAGVAIAVASLISIIRDSRKKMKEHREKEAANQPDGADWRNPPKGRGDYPIWMALAGYTVSAIIMIVLCQILVPQFPLIFLILFAFVYSPLISYVNARLLGIAGQTIEIPYFREGSFILSGAKGVDIWLAPIPTDNYGFLAQAFRVNELTGVSFRSLFKAELVAVPTLLLFSFIFWAFIWKGNEVPSPAFPAAQMHWELTSKKQTLLYSSTFVPEGQDASEHDVADTEFMKAIHPEVIGTGFGATLGMFGILSWLGLPIMFVYGFVRGLGQLPHVMALEIVGALIGRYYYQKKFGEQNFLKMAPTIMAGYFTGVGLMAMATISLNLIQEALTATPF